MSKSLSLLFYLTDYFFFTFFSQCIFTYNFKPSWFLKSLLNLFLVHYCDDAKLSWSSTKSPRRDGFCNERQACYNLGRQGIKVNPLLITNKLLKESLRVISYPSYKNILLFESFKIWWWWSNPHTVNKVSDSLKFLENIFWLWLTLFTSNNTLCESCVYVIL